MTQVSSLTLNDGNSIPPIGLGVFQIPDERTADVVGTAVEAGYRLIDTAAVYGNELGVGKGLADSGVAREEISVVTKVWNDDQGYDETLRAFETSAGLLGLEYVDLYLIHWPRPRLDRYVATWRALEKLKADGRVGSIGVSNFGREEITRLLDECDVPPAVNQIELHPGLPRTELREFHAQHGIATQAWSPLGRGQGFLEHPAITEIARDHGRTPAQVVLRWHSQLGVVPLPKSVSPTRLRGNLDIFGFQLSGAEMDRLTEIGTDFRVGPDPALFFDVS
ncbi:aldo/keto reductase [Actinopolyspora erythraea]|uniref:Aldo/keto reductase n=1 Tax=Actinopolyspora erythraea TaxID=414996 RepID=A0A099D9R1_9ACTN|nr:aldo/keto reductase [Actinopolyspora erythraea]ASU80274.1 aldo/keto reductase [Actinopolyspora erythraea]KGI82641.1 oxidoreductase [Actinopolyspora erythraea]